MSQGGKEQFERASDQALAWIARLNSESVRDEDRQAFALWLARDASHREAMDCMLELWEDLGSVRHLPLEPARPAANQPSWWAGAAVAASLVLALAMWTLLPGETESLLLQTALGEQRSVELEDQSRLTLNTDSRVLVRYEDDQRHLELRRGEVFFEVAPDSDRPFHVDAGSARVTAIGTAFNIQRLDDASAITVTEGVVRVTELGATGNRAPATEVLHANQGLRASPAGLENATRVDAAAQLAWQRGELVAHELPLPQLAAELERYHDLDILIGDPAVAAMTVSGVFQLDQPEVILQALALSHDLQVEHLDDGAVRLLNSPQ